MEGMVIERVFFFNTRTYHHFATLHALQQYSASSNSLRDNGSSDISNSPLPPSPPAHDPSSIHRCIPLMQDGNVVLISSRSGEWILPKGGWERDETAREAAARETYEESGVHGFVHLEPLAETSYRSKRGEACQLLLFVMEVTELLTEWPESSVRQRKVFSLSEAINVCGKEEHRSALQELKLRGLHTLPQHHRLHGAGSHLVDDFGAMLSSEVAASTAVASVSSSSSNNGGVLGVPMSISSPAALVVGRVVVEEEQKENE